MRQTAAVQREKREQVLWHNTLCCTELQLRLDPCTWSDKNHAVGLPQAPSALEHFLGLESNGSRICSVTTSLVFSSILREASPFKAEQLFQYFSCPSSLADIWAAHCFSLRALVFFYSTFIASVSEQQQSRTLSSLWQRRLSDRHKRRLSERHKK